MRVISLVPSWTETLLEAGVEVVGRTRFCVHPAAAVASIPVVGGTKDFDVELARTLRADLLLLDKEENLPWMASLPTLTSGEWPVQVHVSHVESIFSLPMELERLRKALAREDFFLQAQRWQRVLASPRRLSSVRALPGVLEWIRRPAGEPEVILYLIWRGPWMCVARETFIGSVLSHFGLGERIPLFAEAAEASEATKFAGKYPKIDLGNYDPAKTLLLFSSEPYPFGRKREELAALGFPAALVDGESYSWFGTRSLRFLENSL